MIKPELVTYIKSEISKNVSRDEIKKGLIAGGGWTDVAVDEHFKAIDDEMVIQSNESKAQRKIFQFNFFLFALYTIAAFFIPNSGIIFFAYIYHAGFLVLLSVIGGILSLITKKKYYAVYYLLMAIILCVVGFGTCTAYFITGASGSF